MKKLSVLSILLVMFFSAGTAIAAEKNNPWLDYEVVGVAEKVIKFPFKVTGAAVGASLGFIKGSSEGVYSTWKAVNAKYGETSHPYLQVPIGLLSFAYALPVG